MGWVNSGNIKFYKEKLEYNSFGKVITEHKMVNLRKGRV